jgi:serine/threonine protein kinase/Flp pilus assembly protein TadD
MLSPELVTRCFSALTSSEQLTLPYFLDILSSAKSKGKTMSIKCPKCQTENPETQKFCGECATPLRPSKEAEVTETIEAPKEELTRGSTLAHRYEIIEELGKGGMGRVYRVEDTKLKQEVALKLIKPEISSDKKTIERFRNELKIARTIRHKNVCGMFDLGEAEGTRFITMEYVSGEDLKSFIRRAAPLSTSRTISIAKQVCEGLSEAHRRGVVHRDLKPSNIMIDKDGNVRIMDFGIARSLEEKGITGAGVMIGTPEYMSPEQVEGKEVDQRTDIYSLGVILYEMLTGRVPFEGDTALSIAVKHKTEKPKDPRELNTQISEDISLIILKCLEKDKDKRYQSAGEVHTSLENIEKGLPTTERIIPERKPLTSREITVQLSLKKVFIPVLIFIGVIIIGLILWKVLPSQKTLPQQPSDKPSLAILYFENNTGDKALDQWRKGLSELLITDLSQSKYFRVLSGDRIYDILREMDLLDAKNYSSTDLEEIATRGGAKYVLRGGYTRAADTFRININLQDMQTGESIGSETVTGQGEGSFYTMIDELTRRIKGNFRLSDQAIAADIDENIGKITSSSPEAYRYYSEARKYHLRYEYREAIQLYEKAVSIDPEFAMAYRGMAAAYGNIGDSEKDKESIKKALELSDRISERERLQIQGQFYYQSERTYDQAIEAFNKLIEIYPDDVLGNSYLGLIYSTIEEEEEAVEKLKVCVEVQKDLLNCGNLAGAYQVIGLYDDAMQVLEDYLRTEQDIPQVHVDLGRNHLYQGKYQLALEEADKAFLLNPRYSSSFYLRGDAYFLNGDFDKAEEEYLKILELSGDRTTHLGPKVRIAALCLAQGKIDKGKSELEEVMSLATELNLKAWQAGPLSYHSYFVSLKDFEQAIKEVEKALIKYQELDDLQGQRFSLLWKGMYHIKMGSIDEAQKISHELKDLIEKGLNKKAMRYYYGLEGAIELENKNYEKAIQHFNKAISLLPFQSEMFDEHIFFMEPLARAYYKSGDLDKAREEYEKITSLTTGRTIAGNLYATSFYMLGKIYQEQRNIAEAIGNYKKFLDIWKDADPGIVEVENAKKQIAALKK